MPDSPVPATLSRAAGTARYSGKPAITLAVIVLSQFMVGLDGTVVNVALPRIHEALHFSPTGLAWVSAIYTLPFGGLLLLGGRTGDILGRRRMFVVGLVIFALASLFGGLATSATWLLAARAAQGVGAAFAAPNAVALVASNFEEGQSRDRALGAVVGSYAGSLVLGLIAGGMLTLWASWRWVLFINVPIAVLVLVLAPLFINEAERHSGQFDVGGALLSVAGMSSLIYAFLRAASNGWGDAVTVVTLVLAVIMLGAFVLAELRAKQPVVPLSLFRDRNRSTAYVGLLITMAPMGAMLFFVTQLLQNVRAFSPLSAGFAFLPMAAGLMTAGGLAAQILKRIGQKATMLLGAIVLAGGMIWMAQVTYTSSYVAGILGPTVLFGMGAGIVSTALNSAILTGVSPRESGAASSLLEAMNWVGATLGLAVLVTFFGSANRTAAAQPPASVSARQIPLYALAHGMSVAFWFSLLFIGGGFLIMLVFFKGGRQAVTATESQQKAAADVLPG